MTNRRILIVDNSVRVSELIYRLMSSTCTVLRTNSAAEGLEILRNIGTVAVVVSDFRMRTEMDGIEFLTRVKDLYPETRRILITRSEDSEKAIAAESEGLVNQLVLKPINRENIIRAITDNVEKYNIEVTEKHLLQKTFQASVKVMIELLGMADPVSHSRANRMQKSVHGIISNIPISDRWMYDVAALLSQIGCISLPDSLIKKSFTGLKMMSDQDRAQFKTHAEIGANLLSTIPRLEVASEMIRNQFTPLSFDIEAYDNDKVEPAEVGAHILYIAYNYDVARINNFKHDAIINRMTKNEGKYFTPFVEALDKAVANVIGGSIHQVGVEKLASGMVLAEDVITTKNVLVVTEGLEVNDTMLRRIMAFHKSQKIREPIGVYIPA